ncbi:MAG TPA: clostripain-related cysteine peptidase [Pyrinomonadaceae bacterium]|jgi:clostripain
MTSKLMTALFFAVILIIPQIASAQTEAEWTLMFYMDADNNLEAPQMKDLEEMMAVGSSASVNLVVLSDRSLTGDDVRGYTNRAVGGVKNWTTAKFMVIEKGKLRELADWGEVNMGDAATLKKFLQTATAQFPAKHFGLIFGDHGEGWVGIVGDESADGDHLDTTELPPVFKEATAQMGKFDLIGFDACLMGNFEVAKTLAPFGKTMVASEELEPGNGWNYTPLLTALTKNAQMDGVALGKTAVDTYRAYYLGKDQGNRDKSVTLGVIDLQKIPALETAVSNLGVRNQSFMKSGGRNNWIKTSRARSETEEFGQSDEEEGGSHFYDVIDYAENLKLEQPDAETVKAADAAIAAVKSAVVYKVSGAAHPRSSGLSIYFPPDKENLLGGEYQLTPFSISGKWLPFLGDYTGAKLADTRAPKIENVTTTDDDVAANDVPVITAQVKDDDVEETTFVLAESHDNEQIIIGAIPAEPDEKGVLQEKWDGSWFSLGDGKKELICPITSFEELEDEQDTFYVEVPAQVRFKGTKEWRDVTLYFYLDFNGEDVAGEFVYAFSFKGNQPREVEIEAGDSIRPVYLSIDKNGDSSLIASDDENDILNVTEDDNITVGRTDVDAGKYLIGFTATDYAGNTSEEFTEVTIE